MRRAITITLTMLLAAGLMVSFAGPVAAQDGLADVDANNSANSTLAQSQDNTQANSQSASVDAKKGDVAVNQVNTQDSNQSQTGVADATADQGSIDVATDLDIDVSEAAEQ